METNRGRIKGETRISQEVVIGSRNGTMARDLIGVVVAISTSPLYSLDERYANDMIVVGTT